MSWVRIDDHAPEHRKQLAAGPAACWLWLCGLAYANRQPQHDGFIPTAALLGLGCGAKAPRDATRLVEVGLWERVDGGWQIHDYHAYQLTPEQIRVRSESGRSGGVRSGETRRSKREANGEANAKQTVKQTVKQTGSDHRTSPDPDPGSERSKTSPAVFSRSDLAESASVVAGPAKASVREPEQSETRLVTVAAVAAHQGQTAGEF